MFEWKKINEFDDYSINEAGFIRNDNTGKILKNTLSTLGYFVVRLYKNGYSRVLKVHRLLGFAFLGLTDDFHIDHIDRNRKNNSLDNLRIVTNQQNAFNRTAKGYCFDKSSGKWMSYITINKKLKFLGRFKTEEEARSAYLKAKDIYHKI